MTHFAPVGPLALLRELSIETLGRYHLLIAPKVLDNPVEFNSFFRRDDHIILDNGIIELGYPLKVEDLYRAATIVRADVVVLPDTIDDMKMTVKQARQNAPAFRSISSETKLLGVVQGRNFKECLECAESLMDLPVNADWLGVPRGLTPNLGSRVSLVSALHHLYPTVPIHVLGFSENIRDDILAAAQPGVKGLDAATPLWYGNSRSIILPPEPPTEAGYGRRPENYWESQPQAAYEMEYNVAKVRTWLANAWNGAQTVLTSKDEPAVQAAP